MRHYICGLAKQVQNGDQRLRARVFQGWRQDQRVCVTGRGRSACRSRESAPNCAVRLERRLTGGRECAETEHNDKLSDDSSGVGARANDAESLKTINLGTVRKTFDRPINDRLG